MMDMRICGEKVDVGRVHTNDGGLRVSETGSRPTSQVERDLWSPSGTDRLVMAGGGRLLPAEYGGGGRTGLTFV